MEEKEININKGQHLADVYPLIESNIILNKKLSGIGATHCEIIAPRNSIIVVPNVPIITCKVEKHRLSDNLFGVMQNVPVRDIEKYLETTISLNRYIKIMVTPESFHKVRQAFDEAEINMFDSCFLMLDECHKLIKERDFRPEIVQPMRAFFRFKNKALVSATPIIPSDPRFQEQNFKLVKVVPNYYHLFEIVVIETNNIRRAFYDDTAWVRQGNLPTEPQCIFINSATIISNLINDSNLHEISSIFCSDISAVKLKQLGFKNVHTEWKSEYQKPFMFFTSRFFTGLDICLDCKPRVFYFSDAKNADYTMMDPNTDMAQACGRFRNGMKEIFHYIVFNPDIEIKSESDINTYIRGIEKSYTALQTIYDESVSSVERQAILKAIKTIPFSEYFIEGEIDYFLKDNIVDFEILKQRYTDYFVLRDAYGKSGYFKVPMEEEPHFYDEKLLKGQSKVNVSVRTLRRNQRKAIVETLESIEPYRGTETIEDIIYTLRGYDKTIVDAFFVLGKESIVQNDYNVKRLKEELLMNTSAKTNQDEAFLQMLYSSFEVGKKYLRPEAKRELSRIYDKFNLTPPSTITALSLEWHFEIDDKARIGNKKAVKILRRKADGVTKYFDEIKNNTTTEPLTQFED